MYNDFVVASLTSTTLRDNESHGQSYVPEHANDPLHQTYKGFPDDSTENASDNNYHTISNELHVK